MVLPHLPGFLQLLVEDDMALFRSGRASVSLSIVIVGAGLSGLTAAIGLSRLGHAVTVLEQSPELREVGAGIQLPANSSRILDELGLLQMVQRSSVAPRELVIRSYRGEELYTQNLYPAVEKHFHYPHLLIHRATLIRILYEEAQSRGVIIHFSARVKTITFETPKAELISGEQYTADLILGADGEHSTCRELILGRHNPPRSSGDIVYRLSIPLSKITQSPSIASLIEYPRIHAWYGPDSHAVCYPLPKDGIFNVVLTFPEDKGAVTIGPRPANLNFILDKCMRWDPEFQSLLRLADKALKWTLLQTDELQEWVHPSGRMVLVGDSAHATLPYLLKRKRFLRLICLYLSAQGAALAFESAHILSTLLEQISSIDDLPEVLTLYTSLRIPRARRTRQRSKHMHDICQLVDGPAQKERDRILRKEAPGEGFPNPWADPGFQEWMWAFDARAVAERAWEEYCQGNEVKSAKTKQRM